MNPRALAAWSAAALVLALGANNPVYRALLALIALNVVRWRTAGKRLRPLFMSLVIASVVAVALNTFLSHTGEHVWAQIPDWFPGVNGPLTVEAVVYGMNIALCIVTAMLIVASLSYVIEAHQLVNALPRRLVVIGTVVGSSLNVVPGLARSFIAIRDGQRMRGCPQRGVALWRGVMAPTILTAMEDSTRLAEAMEARGFSTNHPRTHYSLIVWDKRATAVVAAAGAAVLLFLVSRVAGVAPDWYPFPSITAPAVEPVMVMACALLATPLVLWRSHTSRH